MVLLLQQTQPVADAALAATGDAAQKIPTYLPAKTASLFGTGNLGIFWRLNLSKQSGGPVRIWMGVVDCPIGIDAKDPTDGIYIGAGKLVDVPDLEMLINGTAGQVDFHLSGIDDKFMSQMYLTAPRVYGAECTVALAPMNEAWQPMTKPVRVWTGRASFWQMDRPPIKAGEKSPMQKIVLRCESGDPTRKTPKQLMFTDAAQRALHSDDAFFDRVVRYTQNYVVSWPHYQDKGDKDE